MAVFVRDAVNDGDELAVMVEDLELDGVSVGAGVMVVEREGL